jgi:hypothetical protein
MTDGTLFLMENTSEGFRVMPARQPHNNRQGTSFECERIVNDKEVACWGCAAEGRKAFGLNFVF